MARAPRLGTPAQRGTHIEIEGLRDLMRDLRKLGEKDAATEVRRSLREAVGPIARDARARAPRSTRNRRTYRYKRHLADTIRPAVQGNRVFIRSPAPHARIVHWGGRRPTDTHNRQKWIAVGRRMFIIEALKANEGRLVDLVGDGLERAARKNGWR